MKRSDVSVSVFSYQHIGSTRASNTLLVSGAHTRPMQPLPPPRLVKNIVLAKPVTVAPTSIRWQTLSAVAILIAAALSSVACLGSPAGPSCDGDLAPAAVAHPVPTAHFDLTATLDSGVLVHVCETQPRAYISSAGVTTSEVDHYIQSAVCPTVPIQ